jgi:anaerobic magnesium-protoporphyrin IX monomethyl ester cyclase
MSQLDLLLVSQSNVVDYDGYADLPLDRLDLYESLVYPRMVHYEGKFRGHLDYMNHRRFGKFYGDATYPERRRMLNIWNLPSMSGTHLANYLSQFGIRLRVINNIDSEWDWFCEAYDASPRPPLVGLSSTFYLSWKEVGRVAKLLRRHDPDMDIVLGGAFANTQAPDGNPAGLEKPMRKYGIRYAVHSFNSEPDLRDLVLAHKRGATPDGVRNLCRVSGSFRDGAFVANPSAWNDPLLAEIPATWDRLELPFLNKTIQIRTASGCPFTCAFCSYPTTARGWKTIDTDQVRAHLDAVMRIPGLEKIIFIDDTFNVPPHRFEELLHVFCEYDFEWFSFLRVQYANEAIIKLMKDSGCRGVYLGIESASDRILKNMNKRATRKAFATGVELLNKYDIEYLAAFVLGFPGEDEDTIRENVDFINSHGVRYYSLKEFYYMDNTLVHEQRDRYDLVGMGNKWAHATMDYERAAQIKLEMFRDIRSSVLVDADTSLWHLAYLYDQGYDFAEIRRSQQEINALMQRQLVTRSAAAPPHRSAAVEERA